MKTCCGTRQPLSMFSFTSWQSLALIQLLTRRGKYTFFALLFWQLSLIWLAFPCSNAGKHIAHGSISASPFRQFMFQYLQTALHHLGSGVSTDLYLKPPRTHESLFIPSGRDFQPHDPYMGLAFHSFCTDAIFPPAVSCRPSGEFFFRPRFNICVTSSQAIASCQFDLFVWICFYLRQSGNLPITASTPESLCPQFHTVQRNALTPVLCGFLGLN